jgi:hypothetical protein
VPDNFVVYSRGVIVDKTTGPIQSAEEAKRLADAVKRAR